MTLTDSEYLQVLSLCWISDDELLLAPVDASLRSLSLRTGELTAREPTALKIVWRVAFDALTDTLLVLTTEANKWELVSLRRSGSQWVQAQRIDACSSYRDLCYLAQCKSRIVLVGKGKTNTMYVFDVSAAHTLRKAGSVPLQSWFNEVACSGRDGDTLVALSHERSLTLQRLTGFPLRLEPLAKVELTAPILVQFYGDILIVADFNVATQKHDICSFRWSGNALNERKVLLEAQHSVSVSTWALVGERLAIVDWDSMDLLVYDLAYRINFGETIWLGNWPLAFQLASFTFIACSL